jgi:LAO/AO transport system kinase
MKRWVKVMDELELARRISDVESGRVEDVAPRQDPAAQSHVVGITGPPGSGKSTLVDGLIAEIRRSGATVAVLAVDPSSERTGGAVLGDRVRMDRHSSDAGVYIRSMATRGSTRGLAAATRDAVRILETAAYDVVIVETVGIGQVELDIVGLADTVAVLAVPALGDIMQMTKAGVMEIGDVFVVNMADRPGCSETVRSLRQALRMGVAHGDTPRPVCTTVATKGEGLTELWRILDEHHQKTRSSGAFALRRQSHARAEFLEIARREWQRQLDERLCVASSYGEVMADLDGGRITPRAAAARILAELGRRE